MAELPRKEQLTGDVTAGEFKKGLNMFYDAVKEMKASSESVDGKINTKANTADVDRKDNDILRQAKEYTDSHKQDVSHLATKSELTNYETKSHASSTYATKSDVESKTNEIKEELKKSGGEWKVAVDSTKNNRTREICTLPAEWKEVWVYAEENISGRNEDSYVPVNIFINKNHKYNYSNTRNPAAYTSGLIGIPIKNSTRSVEFKIDEKNVLYNDSLTILKVVWR